MSLKPWREVVKPHRDVSSGRYRQAEFAADLGQVLRGTAEPEYQDAVEFFSRTYITAGIRQLLVEGLKRLSGQDAEPVIQLQTAFGGGKTHAMLALYHLLTSGQEPGKLTGVDDALEEAGLDELPEARVAVMVGTALSASEEHEDMGDGGVRVRTLWGEMAAQLGGEEAYELVAADDRAGTAPGSTTLVRLFEQLGPCLIMIDELVAFIRKLYQVSDQVAAGSFDSNLTFIQSLTEAVRATKNALLVASIPQSEMEIGGEGGKRVLDHVDHTFGRIEAVWKAADALEGFEIVRRRLFGEIEDEIASEETCRAFHRFYCDNSSDFPTESQESEYLDRMKRAYPIHPEVFDRLYGDWGVLERFQRTRGVLRLLAAVIHELWSRDDQSPLILPGTLPMAAQSVKTELLRYLPDTWTPVMDADVDGENSEPRRIDQASARFGAVCAARKVARAIFLGSAPRVEEQQVRGIETVRILLGVAEPNDQLALFNDARSRMEARLRHLYEHSGRYWYDDQPNLRKTMEDRAQRVSDDDVQAELESRLERERARGVFRGVHVCPQSADVPDEQQVRLVILSPEQTHRRGRQDTRALQAAGEILEERGNLPRQFKNTLLFAAPDEDIGDVARDVRQHLAWQSIVNDREALNLDAHQRREAADGTRRSDETVNVRLQDAYCWLLVPTQEGAGPIEWEITRIPGSESLVERASSKAEAAQQVVTRWSPQLLRMELDRWLWKDDPHINTEQLWNYLSTYCYLSRLKDESVLVSTIREGVKGEDWFGYATGIGDHGQYRDLVLGPGIAPIRIDADSVLVKPEVAREQLERQRAAAEGAQVTAAAGGPSTDETTTATAGPKAGVPRRFYGTVTLDSSRVGGDAAKIAEEVVQHLVGILGAEVKVKLDIAAEVPEGFPESVVRTVSENCRVLGFDQQGFEEE